jgi:hypothetical protein
MTMAGGSSALYRWLRKTPQPHHLEVVDSDGEAHRIELTPGRSCWLTAEETIQTMTDAASVRAYNSDHKLLRAISIAREDDDSDPKTPKAGAGANTISVNGRELAAIIEAQGRAVREAYQAGSEANAAANEALVGIVDTLSARFADALNNINSLAVSAAEQRIALATPPGDPADSMVQDLMKLAMLKAGAPPVVTAPSSNGTQKKGP